MHVLLHAEPLLVTDLDAAVPPLVVVAPFLGVAENLLRVLRYTKGQSVPEAPLDSLRAI